MWYLLRMTPQTSEPKDWWAPRGWAEEQALRVAQEVRRLRGSRSAQWLAGETKQCGHEVTRSVIADLENGRRRYVTTAELTVLAAALQTAPIALLFPAPLDEQVWALPRLKMTRFMAAEEFCGNASGLASADNMAALQLARDIAAAKGTQRALLMALDELGGHPANVVKTIRAELEQTARRIEKLEAERDGG
jgi:hypothetical protein